MRKIAYITSILLIAHSIHAKTATEELLDITYKDISGFSICPEEQSHITKQGGNPTYGEATYTAINTILQELNVGPNDIFYDLGSGTGKVVLQCALDTPAQKVVGIELAQSRHDSALKALSTLRDKKLVNPDRVLFLQTNITQYPFDDATIVFMCSTCFSENLMKEVTNKCAHLKSGAHVISLKQLPTDDRFILHKTFTLPMTWSNDSNVYWYKRK